MVTTDYLYPYPLVLSLSKHCFLFVGLEMRLEGQEQCFDKLSTSGNGDAE